MRIDGLSLLLLLALTLPVIAAITICVTWRRWKLATGPKILVVLGTFVLVVPGTCFGITALAETLRLLAPIDLK